MQISPCLNLEGQARGQVDFVRCDPHGVAGGDLGALAAEGFNRARSLVVAIGP